MSCQKNNLTEELVAHFDELEVDPKCDKCRAIRSRIIEHDKLRAELERVRELGRDIAWERDK